MSPRSGMALLVALAAVIVVLAALAGTLRQLAATQRSVFVSAVHDHHRDLLAVGEQLAGTWVRRTSEQVVLPPAGGAIRVADDLLAVGDQHARLQVWVFDGLAGVPLSAAQPAGELRGALPGRWSAVGLPPWMPGPSEIDVIERTRLAEGQRRYPSTPQGPVVTWSAVGAPAPAPDSDSTPAPLAAPSLVEVIAIASDGRINRNTAPEWLLAAIYAQRERGDAAASLRQRERLVFNEQEDPEGQPGIRLVARSDRWNALIIVTWNGRQRTWWVELSGNSAGVRIVQRHDADQ
jgi:hypothetical protein